ncbi:MAG: hypothetical protein K6T86_17505 [Pirellulales bacterium]|nr:hypothetical protein [Pirellulales bacterium]
MSHTPPPVAQCPDCGATVEATAHSCWLCGAAVSARDVSMEAEVLSTPPPPEQLRMTFTISGMLTVTTLAALCLGVGLIWPGLGIALTIVIVPALVRTWVITSAPSARDDKPEERFATLVSSLAVSFVTLITVCTAAAAAFAGSCFAAAVGSEALGVARGLDVIPVALGVGALAGLAAGIGVVLLIQPLWRRRR